MNKAELDKAIAELEVDDDLQDYTDTPEAWANRRIEGQLSGNPEQVKEADDDKT